uniref:Exo-alpha-sialidase n=1 Tax=candidate division WOR-3 bacterium TaxID=2052148 RepID=A0A7C4GH44_UNCW3
MRCVIIVLVMVASALTFGWQPEVRLTNNSYPDYSYQGTQRRIVADTEGRVHVVWFAMNPQISTARLQVYYRRWYPEQGWTRDTMLSEDLLLMGTNSAFPSLAVDSAGAVYAVWTGASNENAGATVYLKRCIPTSSGNDGWEHLAQVLSVSPPTVQKDCPTVTTTPDGHVHVAWLEGTDVIYREWVDSTWEEPVRVPTGSFVASHPVIAGGRDNRVHLAWYGREGQTGYYRIFYKVRSGTNWSATEAVASTGRHQMYPSLAVNPLTNAPHVIWQAFPGTGTAGRIVHRWRSESGWRPADTLSERSDTQGQDFGQLVFTADGRGHAVWTGYSATAPTPAQVRYCERSVAGTWSAPVNLTDTTGAREWPSVAAGGGAAPDEVHAVWTDYRDGNAEIYFISTSIFAAVEERRPRAAQEAMEATIVRGVLNLRPGMSGDGSGAVLLDASGRKVMSLQPGANDVRSLAPGLYFVRFADCGRPTAGIKVVVAGRS